MTVADLLVELRRRDVEIWAEGQRLRCAAPRGVLTPDLRDAIRQRKSEVLDFLRSAEARRRQPRAIVPLEPGGTRTPVFGVPGHNGDVFCYRALARDLGPDQPFFGLEPPGLDGRSAPLTQVEALASYYAEQIGPFWPHGPLIIAGFCAGGAIAFELGRRLQEAGRTISFIALLGSPHPRWYRRSSQVAYFIRQQCERVGKHTRALWSQPARDRLRYVTGWLDQLRARRDAASEAAIDPVLAARAQLEQITIGAVRRYTPPRFAGRIAQFVPDPEWLPSTVRHWRMAADHVTAYFGPRGCQSHTMLRDYAPQFARLFQRCCAEHGEPSDASDSLPAAGVSRT